MPLAVFSDGQGSCQGAGCEAGEDDDAGEQAGTDDYLQGQ
jgi:hypothetical protein